MKLLYYIVESGEYDFYLCPRCETVIDREYLLFCAVCGQALDWRRCRLFHQISYEHRIAFKCLAVSVMISASVFVQSRSI